MNGRDRGLELVQADRSPRQRGADEDEARKMMRADEQRIEAERDRAHVVLPELARVGGVGQWPEARLEGEAHAGVDGLAGVGPRHLRIPVERPRSHP